LNDRRRDGLYFFLVVSREILKGYFQTKWLFGLVYFTGLYHMVKARLGTRDDKGEKTKKDGIFSVLDLKM
jgi:hypothetical protein